jgi:hypothetical protein
LPTTVTIPITPGSGQNLDAVQLTVNSNTVARENICIADPTAAANIAGVTAAGQLIVTSISTENIDPANSSTATLGSNGVFTGTFTACPGYASLAVEVDTDQISANTSSSGLVVQWSEDGVNIGDSDIAYIVSGDLTTATLGGQTYVFPVKRIYYRIQYTNGAVAQTVFRLQCILKVMPIVGTLVDLNDSITGNMHGNLERVLPFGRATPSSTTFEDFTVKAASTAAAATDTSLVVAINPGSNAVTGPVQTGNAPATVSVGATSATALAANASRTALILINTSANVISLGFGTNAAVLYSGVTLYPGGSLSMDVMDNVQQAITAIASVASSSLGIQEFN